MRPESAYFDRNPDPALDELTELAAVLCDADYAYIGWMDFNRLWFKSHFGFKAPEQPRATTACQWMLEKGEPLLIARCRPGSPLSSRGHSAARRGALPLLRRQCRSSPATQQIIGTLAVLAREPDRFQPGTSRRCWRFWAARWSRAWNSTPASAPRNRRSALRQRTERALAMERCFVAATLDSIPALVTVLDTAGRVVRMNDPCAQLTGLEPGRCRRPAVCRRSFWRRTTAPGPRASCATPPPGRSPARMKPRGARSRGDDAARELDAAPAAGPNGEIQYLIVSGQDVTDQRQMENGAALQRGALSRGGREQPGLCLHLLHGRPAHFAECLHRRDAGLSRRRAGGPRR